MKNKQLLLAVLFFLIGIKSFAQIPKLSANKDYYCSGETATLTVTGCSSEILWTNGATSSSIQVQTGKHFVFCLYNNGLQRYRDSIQIPITKPFPYIIQKGIVCADDPSAKATFYVKNCKGAKIIQWVYAPNQGSPSIIASDIDSIQTNKTGIYSTICQFSCSPTDTANYGSNVIFLDNVIAPPKISGERFICNNEKIALIASGCEGSILWNTGETGTSIQTNIVGIYSALCQKSCGNSLPSNEISLQKSITPAAPIVIPSSATVCNNGKTILQATCLTGTLLWSNVFTSNSITVGAGTYSAICQNDCGSSSFSNVVTITDLITPTSIPIIKSDFATLCNNGIANLTATNCTDAFQWSNGVVLKSSISVNQAGNYFATCVNACGSSGKSNIIQISDCPNCKSICPPIFVKKVSKIGL
jgi:hypothetical protein